MISQSQPTASGVSKNVIQWYFADESETAGLHVRAVTTMVGTEPETLPLASIYRMACLNALSFLDEVSLKEAWENIQELYAWQTEKLHLAPALPPAPLYIDVKGVDNRDPEPFSYRVE